MSNQGKYPIYDISEVDSSGAVESMGNKLKEWITYTLDGKELRILFKEGRPGTGENWAEKVTGELADLIDLPHADYDFGYLGKDKLGRNQYCVICPKFLEERDALIPGNQLIEGFDFDKRKKFKNPTYTIDGVLNALQKNNVHPPFKTLDQQYIIVEGSDLFIGYLCFDAWVGNTDRHDENWAIITKVDNGNILAPTFDHASSLGRNESDESRMKRMITKDQGYNVQAYVRL